MFFLGSERWLCEVSKCPSQRHREPQRESPEGCVWSGSGGVAESLTGLTR